MAITEQTSTQAVTIARPGISPALLVTSPECPARVVEAYHTLFTNLDLALGAEVGHVVAITSVDGSADAHLCAANLALVAAQSGDRTVLVDGDVQAPKLSRVFALDEAPGLAHLLEGEQSDLRTLVQPTALPTLGILTAGLSGARHNRLDRLGDVPAALLRLKNVADRVILVLSPVLSSTDVQRLGLCLDGVLMVLAAGRTERAEAGRARALLQKAQVPVLGAVLAPR